MPGDLEGPGRAGGAINASASAGAGAGTSGDTYRTGTVTLLRAAAATHTGYVRGTNQDLALVSRDLVAVADGMGGHLGGEVAARTAIEELLDAFQRDRTGTGLVKAARRANRTIWKKSRVDRTLHGMGTTLTAAALVTGRGGSDHLHLALVNIGDSRAYALDHDTHELRRLTEDHSVVEEMVRLGELTPEEAAVHPHRHVLTRALGIDADAELDIWDLEPEPGSRFLLCSDGLTNELSEREIGEILVAAEEPEDAARELVGRALGHGGTDNVTVVVVDVVDEAGDSKDMRVALVPASAPSPEAPPGAAPDITEAIPVTLPMTAPPDEAPAESIPVTVPPPDEAPAESIPVTAPPAAGDPGDAPAAQDADQDVASPPADGSAGTAAPVAGTAAAGAAAAGTAAAGAAAAGTAAAGAAAAVPASAEAAAEPTGTAAAGRTAGRGGTGADDLQATELVPLVSDGRDRRTGRSMTVRSRAGLPAPGGASRPLGLGSEAADSATAPTVADVGGHGRPIVLVRRKRERQKDRIVTLRVALFVIIVAALAGGTAGVVLWFEQSSYYVGLDGSDVAIYQGRLGGVLWFKPRLLEDSPLTISQVLPSAVTALRDGIPESTEQAAEQVVSNLTNERGKLTTGIYQLPPSTGPPPTFASTTTTEQTTTTLPGRGGTSTTTAPTSTTTPTTTTVPATTTTSTTVQTTTTTQPGRSHRHRRKKKGHR